MLLELGLGLLVSSIDCGNTAQAAWVALVLPHLCCCGAYCISAQQQVTTLAEGWEACTP